jgi:tetratricopeptide (TPR) repeat protein
MAVRKLTLRKQGLWVLATVAVHLLVASCGYLGGKGGPAKAPPPPQNVHIEQTAEGLHISWTCVPGIAKNTIFWGFDRGEYRGMVNTDSCGIILAGLHKGQLYYLAITAWNSRGESGYSQEQAFVYEDDLRKVPAYLSKGHELLRDGQYVEAQAYLSAAIRLDPQNADAYRYRALLHEKVSRSDLAREDHQMAEKLFKKKPLSKRDSSG